MHINKKAVETLSRVKKLSKKDVHNKGNAIVK